MTTREKIIDEALTLFSIKGFKGTSVKNIADAVGIKDSSLYKHFKNKREILDCIVQNMGDRMATLSKQMGLLEESSYEETAKIYANLTQEGLINLSRKIFLFYLTDAFVSRFWRMANMEQYQVPEIREIYCHIFMEESITYQTALFAELMKQGTLSSADPKVMAMNFYTPIFFLLSRYNGKPELEAEALETLDHQVAEFYRIYHRE